MKTQLLIVLLILFTSTAFSQEMINFGGTVKDSQTGNLLEDINVYVTNKNTGTFTNYSGTFFIFLPGGIYDVTFSGSGYKPEKITFDLRSDKIAEIQLTPTDAKKKTAGWLKKKTTTGSEIIAGNDNDMKSNKLK
jgi:hypothetical protein